MKWIKSCDGQALNYEFLTHFHDDWEFILECVKNDRFGESLKFASMELKKNKEIVLATVKIFLL